MLTFLVLVSSNGRPLPAALVASLDRVPDRGLPHRPETATTWLSKTRHVAFNGWQTRPGVHGGSHWHVGDHGVTAFVGTPWPVDGARSAPSGWAFELTDRLDSAIDALMPALSGATAVVRLEPDGHGAIATDSLGGGTLHVAERAGITAVSNRAAVAADALGLGERATADLAPLAAIGFLTGERSGYRGVRRMRGGTVIEVAGRDGVRFRPGADRGADYGGADAVAGTIRTLVAAAASTPSVARFVDLSGHPGAAVLAGAVAACDALAEFRFRAVGTSEDEAAARAIADRLGVHLEVDRLRGIATDPSAVDAWARSTVARTEASIAPDLLVDVPSSDGAIVLRPTAAWAFTGHPASAAGAATALRARTRSNLTRDGALPGSDASADHLRRFTVAELLGRLAAAEQDVLGAALRIDPFHAEPVLAFAEKAGEAGLRTLLELFGVSGLEPGPAEAGPGLAGAGPFLDAYGHGAVADALDPVLDLPALRAAGRQADPSDRPYAWGTATAAIWVGHHELDDPVGRRPPVVAGRVPALRAAPVLVTGLTSRSILELGGIRIPLDDVEDDPILGMTVDGRVAELCTRILLSVDATLSDLPPDLDRRLASDATAGLVPIAQALVARRGGVLADPRLALTLPFWHRHVGVPQVVLVTERPRELLECSCGALPAEALVRAWTAVAAAAVVNASELRILDPRDLVDSDRPEGIGPGEDVDPPEDLAVATVLDSLIRELEIDDVRPLARRLRGGTVLPPHPARPAIGTAAVPAIAELWHAAAEANGRGRQQERENEELANRVAELEDELGRVRSSAIVRAALRVFGRR